MSRHLGPYRNLGSQPASSLNQRDCFDSQQGRFVSPPPLILPFQSNLLLTPLSEKNSIRNPLPYYCISSNFRVVNGEIDLQQEFDNPQ